MSTVERKGVENNGGTGKLLHSLAIFHIFYAPSINGNYIVNALQVCRFVRVAWLLYVSKTRFKSIATSVHDWNVRLWIIPNEYEQFVWSQNIRPSVKSARFAPF